jgi:hypothetical protein
MRVKADGTVDPSFGVAGRAHVPVPADEDVNDPTPVQLSRLADGRLLVVGYGQEAPHRSAPELFVSRLSADGQLDVSYGVGGRAQPGVETGCYCSAAAVLTDGRLALNRSRTVSPPAPDAIASVGIGLAKQSETFCSWG